MRTCSGFRVILNAEGARLEVFDPFAGTVVQVAVGEFALVFQDIFLFSGTVRENVTMWDSTYPISTITTACRDAAIEDVIQTRIGTFNSEVEEGGGNFSGGQKQRLEIARALVGNPTIPASAGPHTWQWDTPADVPLAASGVILRATVADALTAAASSCQETYDIDNIPSCLITAPLGGSAPMATRVDPRPDQHANPDDCRDMP